MIVILRTPLLTPDGLAKVETRRLPEIGHVLEVASPRGRLAFRVLEVDDRGDVAFLAVEPVESPARADHVGRLLSPEEVGPDEGEFFEGDGEDVYDPESAPEPFAGAEAAR